jgi:uncharacterized protein
VKSNSENASVYNQPMMIETVDEEEKILPLLPPLKQIIGDNGFITIHKVQVV